MDYKAIINLMKEMNDTDLTRLEIEADGVRISMEKAAGKPSVAELADKEPGYASFKPETAESNIINQDNPAAGKANGRAGDKADKKAGDKVGYKANYKTDESIDDDAGDKASEFKKLTAPMVGTFYAQPAPDRPPYIKVGDMVKKGQIICIIEAMKLMNEIESEYDGEVVEVLVKNEDMVEFGQPLFLIK